MRRALIIAFLSIVLLAGIAGGTGYFWLKSSFHAASPVPVDTVVMIKREAVFQRYRNNSKKTGLSLTPTYSSLV